MNKLKTGHRNPHNPNNSAVTALIVLLHDALYELITSPVGTVFIKFGMRMEVHPGPVYHITFDDGRTVNFTRS